MHSFDYNKDINVHHNGDFSGNIRIAARRSIVEDYDFGYGTVFITSIPFDLVKQLYLQYIRTQAMSKLEYMNNMDLERYITQFTIALSLNLALPVDLEDKP